MTLEQTVAHLGGRPKLSTLYKRVRRMTCARKFGGVWLVNREQLDAEILSQDQSAASRRVVPMSRFRTVQSGLQKSGSLKTEVTADPRTEGVR
jgi:hypothetical protein